MIRRIFNFFKRIRTDIGNSYFWGIASGGLIGTSWIPFPPWALIAGLTPLFIFFMRSRSEFKKVFWAAWFCQLTLTLIGFHWIAYVAHEFGFLPWPIAILILFVFAALMHIYLPIAFWFGARISEKLSLSRGAGLVLTAGILAILEQFWPSIFQWNFAYPLLWSGSSYAQLSDVFGFFGLSWMVILVNATFAYIYINRDSRKWLPALISLALILGVGFFWGLQKKAAWSQTDSQVNTLLVQANIGNSERLYAERGKGFQQFILDEFINLTREGLTKSPQTDLIVWPESAFPEFLDDFALSRNYPQQLLRFLKEIRKPLLTGAYSKDPPVVNPRDDYNGIFLFDGEQRLIDPPYHKTDLLVFGEYVPFGRQFPWLARLNPGGLGWGRGRGPQIWNLTLPSSEPTQTQWLKIGPQICYESLNPGFSQKLALLGAEVLVNVTNDSWFGPRFEPYQHLYMTFARGLEVRRPMIRSTNTGVSSVMLANGEVLTTSPLFEKWVGLFEVKYLKNPPLTFFASYGKFLPLFIFSITLLLVIGEKLFQKGRGTSSIQ